MRRLKIDIKLLYKLYCIEGYSGNDLEKVFNADCTTIRKRLKKYGWIRTGKESHNQSRYVEKIRIANLGRKASDETRNKLSIVHKGLQSREKHPLWKGGVTSINKVIRYSDGYIEWRNFIFKRDDYVCQICGKRGVNLRANHIKKFSDFPELRFEKNNGIVICTDCDYKLVMSHEKDWESYFNFNLESRGIIKSDYIPEYLSLERGGGYVF
jgi:hypothetical protein